MDALGGYRELPGAYRLAGDALFFVALALTGFLERLQLELKAAEKGHWWASNGRDVLNAGAFGTMALGLRVVGFTGPIALVIAASLLLVLTAIESALAEKRHSGPLVLLAACALGAPVLFIPRAVQELFRAALEWLFRGG